MKEWVNSNSDVVSKAMRIVTDCKPEDFSYVTVGWTAREIGVSVPNLSRAFKRAYKITFQSYLIMVKMFKAFILMYENSNITVKELAAALDYNSTSQFIAAFRRVFGMTPGRMLRSPDEMDKVAVPLWIMARLTKYRKFNRRRG